MSHTRYALERPNDYRRKGVLRDDVGVHAATNACKLVYELRSSVLFVMCIDEYEDSDLDLC